MPKDKEHAELIIREHTLHIVIWHIACVEAWLVLDPLKRKIKSLDRRKENMNMRSRLAWQWTRFFVTHVLLNALSSIIFMSLLRREPPLSPVRHRLMSWLCPMRQSKRFCMLRGRSHWDLYMVFSLFWKNFLSLYAYHSTRHLIKSLETEWYGGSCYPLHRNFPQHKNKIQTSMLQ